MKNDFKPVVGHRFNLRESGAACWTARSSPFEPNKNAVLHLEFYARRCGLQSEERGDLYAHANAHGDSPAHGAIGLPGGSETSLRRRQGRVGNSSLQTWSRSLARADDVCRRNLEGRSH